MEIDNIPIDPKLDLVFERVSTLPVEKIWKAWTDSEVLKQWFCPRPWKVIEARIELCSGGEFSTTMQGPDGQLVPGSGCYLELIENKKLVWTNMMTRGYRPSSDSNLGFPFVVIVLLSKSNKGTLYKAIVKHSDEEGRKKHEAMGFQEGWGKAFDQLEELMKN